MNERPDYPEPFRQVCEMEGPLTTITDLALVLASLSETMEDGLGRMVQRLAWLIHDEAEKAENLRGRIFGLTHPRRDAAGQEAPHAS